MHPAEVRRRLYSSAKKRAKLSKTCQHDHLCLRPRTWPRTESQRGELGSTILLQRRAKKRSPRTPGTRFFAAAKESGKQ